MQGLPRSSSTTLFSSETWQQLTTTLSTSGNVAQVAQYEESLDTVKNLLNSWFDAGDSMSEQRTVFAQNVLKEMLLFALTDSQPELSYTDSDGNRYVASKTETTVRLVKQPSPAWDFSWDNGLQSVAAKETLLYEFDIPTLKTEMVTAFNNANSSHSANALSTLLSNNQKTLQLLAYEIIENKSQSLPAHLVKLAKHYVWHTEHVSRANLDDRDTFMEYKLERTSPALSDFLRNRTLPRSDKEKCVLAWEFCNFTAYDVCANTAYLIDIFKDIQHADFTAESLRHDERVWGTFHKLCNFLAYHFEGNAISFGNISRLAPKGCVEGLNFLISHNPNVKSISFSNSDIVDFRIEELAHALEANTSLVELSFNGCHLSDRSINLLAEALSKNSTVKVLNLKYNRISLIGAQMLMRLPNLTSLNLEENELRTTAIFALLDTLKQNQSLTYCNLGQYQFPGMARIAAQIERHLAHNAHNAESQKQFYEIYEKTQLLSYSEAAKDFPMEILHLVFNLGIAAVKQREIL